MPPLLAAFALAACSHGAASVKPQTNGELPEVVQVQDSLHAVTYQLPRGDEAWQVSREGNAHTASGVQAEVSTFPMAKETTPAACREAARAKLTSRKDQEPRTATAVDPPRDQTIGDAPTAIWSFTIGSASAPVRNRWAFYARGADCVVLQVESGRDDTFAGKTFDVAARTLKVLELSQERQREVDLLAGMGFSERHDPQSALERFEMLARREPGNAKAHFGALMAGFEIGQQAYARVLPHGKAALKAEHDLTPEQREFALRAVGIMQLAENQVRDAADTLAELVVRAPSLAEGQYNYACALARLGDAPQAMAHLRAAIQLNGELAPHARDDDDLKALRGSEEFQQLTTTPQANKEQR